MNKQFTIAKVAFPLPVDKLFDYYIPQRLIKKIQTGIRVNVLFNKKETIGFIVGCSLKSRIEKLNPIINIVDKISILTPTNLQLARRIKDYYVCSLGEAIEAMVPYKLRKIEIVASKIISKQTLLKKRKKNKLLYLQSLSENLTLNYLRQEIETRIKNNKRVIFLAPEIKKVNEIYNYILKINAIKIGIWHGRLSMKEMYHLWNEIVNDRIDVVIGTRSCIFAPLKNLDLIIIYEESNSSYKDDQVPYYHAIEIAQMRSEIEKCDVILSSMIPSISTYQLILSKKIIKKNLKETKFLAEIYLAGINYKNKINVFLEKEIVTSLERKEKILVFLNRKGFATFIYCLKCKYIIRCSRCSSNLRFVYSKKKLICPYCNNESELVEICPQCNCAYVKYEGLGIEKLESNLQRNFPEAKIITLEELLKTNKKFIDYDIVVATKKILNFNEFNPDITIIWDLDNLLNIEDFNSAEETFRLLSQLLLMTTKKLIICSSFNWEFYLLKNLRNINFKDFYKKELITRRDLRLPPYYHIGLVSIRGLDKNAVRVASKRLYSSLKKTGVKKIEVSVPYTTLRSRIREKYYKYLLVKSKDIMLLNRVIKKTIRKSRNNKVIITVNIDPN